MPPWALPAPNNRITGNMHRHMRTHLHKDSLARQQQEQQMKNLVGGAQIKPAATASTTSGVTSNTTTSPINNNNTCTTGAAASSQSAQLASSFNQYHPCHLAPLIGESLVRGSSSPSPSSSALALAAVTSSSLASVLPFGQQRLAGKAHAGVLAEPGIVSQPEQQNSVSALINQQLVAAFKQQQQHKIGLQTINDLHDQVAGKTLPASVLGHQQHQSMAAESQAALKYLHRQAQQQRQQLDPKSIMMGALQDDQLGFESVKAVMLAAAAAAAAAAVSQQQHQAEPAFGTGADAQLKLNEEQHDRVASDESDLVFAHHQDSQQVSLHLQQQQRVRGKRRKQVNPRSTRAHPATSSSLNSGDDADEDTDEEIRQLDSLQKIMQTAASDASPTTTSTLERVRRNSSPLSDEDNNDQSSFEEAHQESSSARRSNSSRDRAAQDEDTNMSESTMEQTNQSEQPPGNLKQQVEAEPEDFNNNQGEVFALKKVKVKRESNVDHDDNDEEDQDDQDQDDQADEDERDLDEEDDRVQTKSSQEARMRRRRANAEFATLRMNLANIISDEENEDQDEDEASLGSDVNMNLSDNNNSSSSNQMTPFADNVSSGHESLHQNRFDGQNRISNSATGNIINHFRADEQLSEANPTNIQSNNSKNNDSNSKMIPLTNVEDEVIEDISQSYVKTANPNAARKGGKRNRHCYKCKLCTYSSVDRCTLVRHLRIHSGERPYICGICRYAFTTKANCERHVRKRHKKQYNSLGGAGGGGVKGSNGGGRSLIITDHSNHQTIPVKVNPVAAQTITQTLQRIQEKQQNSVDDDEHLSIDNIERINNHHHHHQQQQQHHHDAIQHHRHHQHHVDTIGTNNIDTTSLSGYKQGKRKQRDDELHPENQGAPYQRRRLVDKQQHQNGSLALASARAGGPNRKSIERLAGANLMFNPRSSSFNQQQVPADVSATNELFANLVAQLQQVTNRQQQDPMGQDSDLPNLTAQLPQTSPVPGPHLASATFLANMLAVGKGSLDPQHADHLAGQSAQQQQSAASLAGAQRSLLSSSKHLSQQFQQLRNLNSQNPLFTRRNPFDPFNPIDLAAQALDLSCKFQSK